MIILLKASSFLMRRVMLVRNVGVSLVCYRCLWLPCCILFWVSCTRDFAYYFLSYIYLNVFGCVFISSCYVFLMGFFHRSVLWRWCMCCWERCLSTVVSGDASPQNGDTDSYVIIIRLRPVSCLTMLSPLKMKKLGESHFTSDYVPHDGTQNRHAGDVNKHTAP
jgi:hypothetical protein